VGWGLKIVSYPAKSPVGVGCWNLGEEEKRVEQQQPLQGFCETGSCPVI
jgi:hypothetical protein